jgi:multiple sugar transport system substrate-binding protein
MKQLLRYAVLCTVLLALVVPGFATAARENVTLEFWGGWTGPDADTMKGIVKQWNDKNPNIQVNLTTQAWSPLFDAFLVAAGANKSPDILAMHPPEIPQFVGLGLLTPLDDVLAKSTVIKPDNYLDTAWKFSSYDGKQYGVPLDMHMHGLFYNVDLFKAAGIKDPPKTGKELLEDARLLTIDKNGKHAGEQGFDPKNIVQYGINMYTNHHAFYEWYSLYNQEGGKFLSDDGKSCAIDVDKATTAWQFLQDLVYKENVAPQGQTDYPRDFLSKRTAMLVDGPWRMPQLEDSQAKDGFNWADAPFPVIFDKPAVWGSGHTLTLPSKADPAKQGAAVQFLEWLAANSTAWAKSGNLPAFKAVMESKDFQSMTGRQAFISQMPVEVMLPNTVKYNQIFATNAPTPIMVMAQNIILKQADPQTEVKNACDTINSILVTP